MITYTRMLPLMLITINLLSSAIYGYNGDWRRCVYWIAAAVLTAMVTF